MDDPFRISYIQQREGEISSLSEPELFQTILYVVDLGSARKY